MSDIKTFTFDREGFDAMKRFRLGRNWPVVYILERPGEMYVGETVNVYIRSKQHFENVQRRSLKRAHVITDEYYNKSATLDIESWLIQYLAGEGTIALQNGNSGLRNHNYYEKEKFEAKFEVIWDKLREMRLVSKSLQEIRNSDLFKYSPYKSLNEEQYLFVKKLFRDLKDDKATTYVVSGSAGTGKTVLATFLVKYLTDHRETKDLKVALVVAMGPLRSTLKKVFSKTPGLKASMVIGPNEVANDEYDLLIVDEAHRLKRRKNLGTSFSAFDKVNKKLGLPKEATQLDWVLKRSRKQVLFYDVKQSVMPSDVCTEDFRSLDAIRYDLATQMRIQAGDDYVRFIDGLLESPSTTQTPLFKDYDFRLIEDFGDLHRLIKDKDKHHGLSRIVAGYAWPWLTNPAKSKTRSGDFDIELDDYQMRWNSTTKDWVNSVGAINEVGCIHTTQGYGLNYVGVVVGAELTYDEKTDSIQVIKKNYHDRNGFAGISSDDELKRYIINIYKTLLTRGIKGTYVYVVDKKLRSRFKKAFGRMVQQDGSLLSPLQIETQSIPLLGSAPCGNPFLGEENTEGYVDVESTKIKPGYRYFILRAEGDSMNNAGINDGDLVLCRTQEKADTGDRVVALLDGNVTIKEYGPRIGDIRLLLPRSKNKEHKPITPEAGDTVQGVVQEVLGPEKDFEIN